MSEPFAFRAADEELERLRRRLDESTVPAPTPGAHGIPMPTLQRLLDRWRGGFDWRAVERRLFAHEHRVATVEGTAAQAGCRSCSRTAGPIRSRRCCRSPRRCAASSMS
ncbi:epoxide hydrolase N-terminal domain-containing protein [Agrococcus sp. Marseille-Q4369]|uniref:epoxide hydrolase N-terminal domain-containing protein n=1 Tax=Agrococcus sp. Marseille-Q4369 TaxID=2810513 RepID=UPI002016754A|nr:epoxide hydrolase N-terminal domain-containing protein [Agrococcus sp. Marseille-Q4369]